MWTTYVVVLNPIILDALDTYFKEKPDTPTKMQQLIKKLLELESVASGTNEGMDKLYDQVLDQFVSDDDFMQWSKKYVSG